MGQHEVTTRLLQPRTQSRAFAELAGEAQEPDSAVPRRDLLRLAVDVGLASVHDQKDLKLSGLAFQCAVDHRDDVAEFVAPFRDRNDDRKVRLRGRDPRLEGTNLCVSFLEAPSYGRCFHGTHGSLEHREKP